MDDASPDDAALFSEGPDGRIVFTPEGRAYFGGWFGYAGIDLRRIRTRAALDAARRQAFPYLFDYTARRLGQRPQTLETRALLAVVSGDWDAYARARDQLATRERLVVLDGGCSDEAPPPDGRPVRS